MVSMRNVLVLVALVAATSSVAGAAALVQFVDGRSMRVEEIEWSATETLLHLEGGGALSVPAERVAGWHPLPDRIDESDRDGAASDVAGSAWRSAAGPFADLFAKAAADHDLDPALLTAMAKVESALDPAAVSHKGAGGLLQLMPNTADRFGVTNVFDAAQNVDGGARYLSWLLERFDGRTDLALAGYNAGEGAVDRHQGIPPYDETRRYVRKVLDGASRLADLAP